MNIDRKVNQLKKKYAALYKKYRGQFFKWKKKLKSRVKYYNDRYSLLTSVYLIFTSLISGFLFLILENYFSRNFDLKFFGFFDFLIIIILFSTYWLILWLVTNPLGLIKKQRIHNLPSYFFYWYFSLILAPLSSPLIAYLINNSSLFSRLDILGVSYFIKSFNSISPIDTGSFYLMQRGLIVLGGIILYSKIKPDILTWNSERFAPGSVGLKDDQLDFADKARNEARGIKKLTDHVEVITLRGGMGAGKSSYARMMVESLSIKDTLYSYISLTETNEAKDFSILFSERWSNTLSSRYPKLDMTDLDLLRSITREFGYGFISEVMYYLSKVNLGLERTKSKVVDKNLGSNPKYVSKEVSRLFANSPQIVEGRWVFVIDEIERAPLNEVYRVIEIIERFKSEGRTGLPVQLIFILCVSESDLQNILKNYLGKDYIADLVNKFFFEDPKSISIRIFLPPTPYDQKQEFIAEQVSEFMRKEAIEWQRKEI